MLNSFEALDAVYLICEKYLHEYNQREAQTLIHGDFHGANNMFGVNENQG